MARPLFLNTIRAFLQLPAQVGWRGRIPPPEVRLHGGNITSAPLLIYTLLIWARDVAVPALEEISNEEMDGKDFLTLSIYQIDSFLRDSNPDHMNSVERPPPPSIQLMRELDSYQELSSQFPEGVGPAEPPPASSEPQALTLASEPSPPEASPSEVEDSVSPGSESGTPGSDDSAAGVPVPGEPDHGRRNSSSPVARRSSTDVPKPIVTG